MRRAAQPDLGIINEALNVYIKKMGQNISAVQSEHLDGRVPRNMHDTIISAFEEQSARAEFARDSLTVDDYANEGERVIDRVTLAHGTITYVTPNSDTVDVLWDKTQIVEGVDLMRIEPYASLQRIGAMAEMLRTGTWDPDTAIAALANLGIPHSSATALVRATTGGGVDDASGGEIGGRDA